MQLLAGTRPRHRLAFEQLLGTLTLRTGSVDRQFSLTIATLTIALPVLMPQSLVADNCDIDRNPRRVLLEARAYDLLRWLSTACGRGTGKTPRLELSDDRVFTSNLDGTWLGQVP